MAAAELTSEAILKILSDLPPADRYWVAYSGGVDSHVLLHLIAALRGELRAEIRVIHVDHGLVDDAANWSHHCETVCRQYDIPLVVERITSPRPGGASLEAWAREQRYDLLARHVCSGEILLTAHHQQDQAETLLLQLLRGGGVKGLAAMPYIRKFHNGWHVRPLLGFTRGQILACAGQAGLRWVEDRSNTNECFDRNFLRRQIWPRLEEHWPGVTRTLARAAVHQADAAALLADLGRADLGELCLERKNILDNRRLQSFDPLRRANLLRHWLKELGLPAPDSAILRQLVDTVINSRYDASPCLRWCNAEVRRYRHVVFAGTPLPSKDHAWTSEWNLPDNCMTPVGMLRAELVRGRGLRRDAIENDRLCVRYRKGGENIKPVGDRYHRELRKLFQQRGVLPWYRDWVPLLYSGERLAAVAGLWQAGEFAAVQAEPGWVISWSAQADALATDVSR